MQRFYLKDFNKKSEFGKKIVLPRESTEKGFNVKKFQKADLVSCRINSYNKVSEKPAEKQAFRLQSKNNNGEKSVVVKRVKVVNFKRKLSVGISAAIIAALMSSVTLASDLTTAYQVFVNDTSVGFVSDKAKFEETLSDVKTNLSKLQEENIEISSTISEPKYTFAIVPESKISNTAEIKNNIMLSVDETVNAFCIMVDGEAVVGLPDKETAVAVIDEITAPHISDENISLEYTKKVSIEEAAIPVALYMDKEGAKNRINGVAESRLYTIEKNDTFWDISIKFDITVDELQGLNPDVNPDKIKPGQQITVVKNVPLFSIKTVKHKEINEEIPYSVREEKSSQLYKGKTKVKQEGVPGSKQIVADITYIDGVEVERIILSEQIISNPVEKVVLVGTVNPPTTAATGNFLRPVGGYVSSPFGKRWGGSHTGVDYATSSGTSIKAADGGKVTFSGWSGGYGKLIIIDHGNGYQTYYAHCSSLLVGSGKRVAKGQVIARVGNTGNSTGPHLHFEIRKNGVPQNPHKYY